MAHLDIKIKLANTFATILLLVSQGFTYSWWYLRHTIDFGPRDFSVILIGFLQLLLIGFTIYQYLPSSPKDVYKAISYWYLLVAIINSGVAFLWLFRLDIFAFVGLLWQWIVLVFIYHRLRDFPPRHGTDHLLLNAPFSIYTAHTFFVVFWQLFQFREETKQNQVVHSAILLIVGFVALHLVDYSHRKDWVYALTTAWILLGTATIFTEAPHTISLIVVGVLISAVARCLVPNTLNSLNRRFGQWTSRLGERTPLLGH